MSTLIDENIQQSFDPLALLRPVPGGDGVCGLPPDSADAPKVRGGNAFIWLASTRKDAVDQEELDAGLGEESEEEKKQAAAEPPARLWERIFNVSQQYLRNNGKDIRIAFHCLEAWIRKDGLDGLNAGLELLRGCIAAYWETLHPLPAAGGGTDRRIDCLIEYYALRDDAALEYSPLFFALTRHVPVATDGKNTFFLHDALETGTGSPDPARISASLRTAAAATPPETAGRWLAAARRAVENCAALERLAASPEFSRGDIPFPAPAKLRRRLEEIESFLLALHPRSGASPEAGGELSALEAGASPQRPASAAGAFPDPGRLVSLIASSRRADNLRLLRVLGRRFQDTEPHSPVGYVLARWAGLAELPLPKLLDELGILGGSERSALDTFAGVRAPESK